MEWNNDDIDTVTSRIEKINMQFSKLLEEMNVSTETTTVAPTNFKVSLGEIEQPTVTTPTSTVSTNYYANMIEKSRQVKGIPKHAIALELPEKDRKLIDNQLEKLYTAKKEQTETSIVYNMKEICDANKSNMVVIQYSSIPVEKSLVVKRTWKDVLFSDIDLNKEIDVWGAVKRFCKIQIKL